MSKNKTFRSVMKQQKKKAMNGLKNKEEKTFY